MFCIHLGNETQFSKIQKNLYLARPPDSGIIEIFNIYRRLLDPLASLLKITMKTKYWRQTESLFMLRYLAIALMISFLRCNFKNLRTDTKIIQELELNKN